MKLLYLSRLVVSSLLGFILSVDSKAIDDFGLIDDVFGFNDDFGLIDKDAEGAKPSFSVIV